MGQRHLEAGFAVLLAAAVMFPGLAGAQTAPLTRLYAPKPPQGSAYVRVVNPTAAAAAVSLAGGAPVTLGPATERALAYRVAPGGKPVTLTVDGKPVAGEIVPVADGFLTIALSGGPGGWSAKPLPDATEGRDDLKVMLRFYNLAEGCTAALAVADGPTVFDGVPQSESRQRAINPVDASLVGRCGPLASAPVRLPKLKAGDHYSLFLGGNATAPILQGQVDETEPYRGTAN